MIWFLISHPAANAAAAAYIYIVKRSDFVIIIIIISHGCQCRIQGYIITLLLL